MIYAVISEFNPFHNGHRYLLSRLPHADEDYTVCIMSGSFVQRGEPAAYDKWARAAAAIRGGADLVLELPLPYALSDGDRFAAKGVELAAALGQAVTLAFGTECRDLLGLEKIAALSEEELAEPIRTHLEQGFSYGAARQAAVTALLPQESALLQTPNNLLACGYIRACLQRKLSYCGIQRTTVHDGAPAGDHCSASYVRAHPEEFDRYCPYPQGARLDAVRAESGIRTLLATRTAEELRRCANISEGLENRILTALQQTEGLQDLYDTVKTKRYSHAKLRRAIMSGALGLPRALPSAPAPYLRALAFGPRGTALLRSLRKTALLPLCQSGRECEQANPAFFAIERRATDLRNSWSEQPLPIGEDYRKGAIYVTD